MTYKRIKTTKKEIVSYWHDRIALGVTNVSVQQAEHHCWRCGVKKRLDRCHIVASALGGEDKPENFVLLCKHCHFDNPNLNDVAVVWDWILAYHLPAGQSFWYNQGLREYEFIYGESLETRLAQGNISQETFEQALNEALELATVHFGQPGYNRATVAGAMRRALEIIKDVKYVITEE